MHLNVCMSYVSAVRLLLKKDLFPSESYIWGRAENIWV